MKAVDIWWPVFNNVLFIDDMLWTNEVKSIKFWHFIEGPTVRLPGAYFLIGAYKLQSLACNLLVSYTLHSIYRSLTLQNMHIK